MNKLLNKIKNACFSVPEQKNPLLLLKQSGVGTGIGRVKRRYKRKNGGSPAKTGPSPVKRRQAASSPAKALPLAVGKVSQGRLFNDVSSKQIRAACLCLSSPDGKPSFCVHLETRSRRFAHIHPSTCSSVGGSL